MFYLQLWIIIAEYLNIHFEILLLWRQRCIHIPSKTTNIFSQCKPQTNDSIWCRTKAINHMLNWTEPINHRSEAGNEKKNMILYDIRKKGFSSGCTIWRRRHAGTKRVFAEHANGSWNTQRRHRHSYTQQHQNSFSSCTRCLCLVRRWDMASLCSNSKWRAAFYVHSYGPSSVQMYCRALIIATQMDLRVNQ